ncbi:MAG: hypothetical protein EXS05_01195 [Planctomycetaceae bacterium]|nr:hypothetical protein [Planctomycetaceae bacterium]
MPHGLALAATSWIVNEMPRQAPFAVVVGCSPREFDALAIEMAEMLRPVPLPKLLAADSSPSSDLAAS